MASRRSSLFAAGAAGSLVLALCLAEPLCAGVESVGTTSANFLKIPADARPASMGEAFTALSDDESSLLYNPAGTARILQTQLSATHIEWFQGIRIEHLGGVSSLGPLGTIGAGLSWLQVDDLVRTQRVANTSDPLANFVEDGTFSPHDMALALNWAWRPAPRWNAGLGLKILQQAIDSQQGWGLGLDLGAQYTGVWDWLDLGFEAQNVGSAINVGGTSFQQPITFSFGGAAHLLQGRLVLSADVSAPSDNDVTPAFGAEWWIAHTLAFRGGWRGGYANQPTAGAGFRIAGMQIDYAWQPYEDLGDTHRITASYSFGTPSLSLKSLTPLMGPLGEAQWRQARFQPDVTRPEAVESWRFQLIDAQGHVAKTVLGDGPPPDSFKWDGKDDGGHVMPDGVVNAQLSLDYGGGVTADSNQAAVELDSTPPVIGLDIGPQIVRPGTQTAVLIPARIQISAQDKHGVGGWKLEVRDVDGKLFRAFSGDGDPPQPLIWDGSNGQGLQVESGKSYIFWPFAKDKLGNWGQGTQQAMLVLLKELHFDIASDALFEPGKADVRISAYQQLKDVKDMILKHYQPGTMVDIVGHTDNQPTIYSKYSDNQALSLARAQAVVKFLVTLLDMDQAILRPVGMGDSKPLVSNDTPEGREKNRRVEVVIHAKEYR
jgi:outer membrane protein OmpA-like peptidoglycan-associated protein